MQDKKPRILHVLDNTFDGGTKVVILTICEQLREHYDFTIVNLGPKGRFSRIFTNAGLEVIELGTRLGKWYPLDVIPLARIIRRLRPDLIHLCLIKSAIVGGYAARICRVPYVVHDHTSLADVAWRGFLPIGPVRGIVRKVYGHSVRKAARVFVLTPADADAYLKDCGVPRERIAVVYNPVDIAGLNSAAEASRKQSLREQLNLGPATKIVLFVGRLTVQKDPIAFLKVAERLVNSEAAFVMAGDGPMRGQVEEYITTNGIKNTYLLGYREDVPALFRQADVFVSSSLWEGFGLVILEAMALGCPVVATANSGTKALIEDGSNGQFIPAGDVDGITDALSRLLADDRRRAAITSAGLETAARFAVRPYSEKLRSLYDDIIGRKQELAA